MLASYFARNYAMYALSGQYRGPNLVVPNFFVPGTSEEQLLHTTSGMCGLLQTDQEDRLHSHSPNDRSAGCDRVAKQSDGQEENECAQPEIKFSIDRILSIPSYKRSVSTSSSSVDKMETGKDIGEMDQTDGKDENFSEDVVKYSWLQCTRYKPPKLQRLRKKEGGKKRKLGRNPRVPFTQYQVATLERKFAQTHYLSSIDVAELSAALSLTETRVKIWFQNRRARERRDRDSDLRPTTSTIGQPPGPGRSQAPPLLYHAPSSSTGASPWGGLNIPTPPQTSLARLHKAMQQRGGSAFTPVSYSGS